MSALVSATGSGRMATDMGGSIAQARSRYNPVHNRRQLSAAARRAGRGARGAQSFNARGGDRLGGEPCHDAAGRLVVAASLERSAEHPSALQSLMRIQYAFF